MSTSSWVRLAAVWLCIAAVCFSAGRASHIVTKPKPEIVYDLTQHPDIIKAYASAAGLIILEKSADNEYSQGYKKGYAVCSSEKNEIGYTQGYKAGYLTGVEDMRKAEELKGCAAWKKK